MINLIFKTDESCKLKMMWTNGLSAYTQSNCQVTLADDGFRIYRPANLTVASNGNTMWGGLKLVTSSCMTLEKGHTYIIKFHVKGKTSNGVASWGWTNQMGWGGGGLYPSPSNVVSHCISSNFNGEDEVFYQFTINDDVYKVCTTSYSGFVQGNTYLSYRDFMFGFSYTDTGSMGTDLYLSDFRMYDLTNGNESPTPDKQGIFHGGNFIESTMGCRLSKDGEVLSNDFIEI